MKDFWTSISAFENAKGKDGKGGCIRRWWFDKICKLPQPASRATIFGDVFHAVLARFYLADDRGLDATGKPVNLYPPGWKSVKSRFAKKEEVIGEISVLDETLIRTLVDKAIADGYLIREPGRLVEREVSQILYTDPITGQKIVWKGFIDLETNQSVEDHKTSKAVKWLVSAKKLKTNVQMMMYGWDKYERGHSGDLWLRHNNYIKNYDDPRIIQRSAEVNKEYVYGYYNTVILPGFKEMLKYSQRYPATDVEKWRDLPPTNNAEKECNYYYGHTCPYIGICTGQCNVALYRAKYELLRKENSTMGFINDLKEKNAAVMGAVTTAVVPEQIPAQPLSKTELVNAVDPSPVPVAPNPMDVLSKIRAATPSAAPVVAASAPESAPAPKSSPEPVDDRPKAPWHFPGCVACRDNPYGGFNSKGTACVVCDAQSEQHGKLKSIDYSWVYDENNNLVFTQNPGAVPTFPEKVIQETKDVAAEPEKQKKVKTRKARTKKQKAAPDATSEVVPEIVPEANTNGFTLLIGCAIFKAGSVVPMSADNILAEALKVIELAAGKSAAEIEHFALLQGIDAQIPEIVQTLSLSSAWVVSFQPTKGTALARLVDGLRAHADMVIVNIGM